MHKKIFLLVITICNIILTKDTNAQSEGHVYLQDDNSQVKHYNQNINSAWSGGVNSMQPVDADLNNDGKLDLVMFDHSNGIVKTFLNIGNTNQTLYKYEHKYEKNFPKLISFLLLKDYNCDGIADLFTRSDSGFAVCKGYFQNNELKFQNYRYYYYPAIPLPIIPYIQLGDIPALEDMDHDGDLDLLAFDVQGTYLYYYKNVRVENNLPCDTIAFTYSDKCWGKFYQTVFKTAILNITCKGGEANNKKTRHAGNCILAFDAEGDGDYDLLDGTLSSIDIQFLINGASANGGNNLIVDQDTMYNQTSQIVNMPSWIVPSLLDINSDGKKDLIFSSHTDNIYSANYNVALYYKNIGTSAIPNFVYQHDTLFTPDMIDIGSFSYPTFFDYDKDGKQDLFIGGEGYLNNANYTLQSKLAYYRNTSSASQISFELISKDFLQLSALNYQGIFPNFGDITGDGIDDLIFGGVNGKIVVYKNLAASNSVTPNFQFLVDSIPNVQVDAYSMPFLYDYSKDGKPDLLIGNQEGHILYYKDTSSTNAKIFNLTIPKLGNVKAGKTNTIDGYAAPFVGKMDFSGKDFLLVGNTLGTIQRFDSLSKFTFPQKDSMYSFIKTTNRAVPAIADLDGDGMYEMVVGNKLGGLSFYKQVLNGPQSNGSMNNELKNLLIYPNPTSNQLNFELPILSENPLSVVSVFDISGRKILQQEINLNILPSISTKTLKPGIYFLEISHGGNRIVRKFIKE